MVNKLSFIHNVLIRYEASERETDGIDLSTTCTFTIGSQGTWTVTKGDIDKETNQDCKEENQGMFQLKRVKQYLVL